MLMGVSHRSMAARVTTDHLTTYFLSLTLKKPRGWRVPRFLDRPGGPVRCVRYVSHHHVAFVSSSLSARSICRWYSRSATLLTVSAIPKRGCTLIWALGRSR